MMPLRYADPSRRTSPLVRAVSTVFRSRLGQSFIKNVAARTDPWLDRVSHGRLNWGLGVVPTATLVTTGAKSGLRREAQVAYFHDGPGPIVVASHYGGPTHPGWYHNLVAHPECELSGDPFVAAEVTDERDYERLFALAEQVYAGYADYREKTALVGRRIPIVRLTAR